MRQKKDYDVRLKVHCYEVGDLIYLYNSATKIGISNKLLPIWTSPYIVTQKLSNLVFRIEGEKRSMVVHHDRMKTCRDRVLSLWIRRRQSSPAKEVPQDVSNEFCGCGKFV
jgi:hypothetical protein